MDSIYLKIVIYLPQEKVLKYWSQTGKIKTQASL